MRRTGIEMRNLLCLLALSCVTMSALGCSSSSKTSVAQNDLGDARAQVYVIKAPGIVEHVWEEPMVDVIDVPPGLDPEGRYYRPAHQSIVEIRQGHWRYRGDPANMKDAQGE
jgi:hypothetical protein